MNSATTNETAGDLICMGLEVEEDLAAEDRPGKAAAIHHLRKAVEEVGDVGLLMEIIADAAGGALDMHPDHARGARLAAIRVALMEAAILLGDA